MTSTSTGYAGVEGIKEAALESGGMDRQSRRRPFSMKLGQAACWMKSVPAHRRTPFIEIMGCPGGCINGGGQSIVNASVRNVFGNGYMKLRAQALYEEDVTRAFRKSHENVQIQQLYTNFLKEPGSPTAHHLLHTHYKAKKRFKIESK
jgi:NADP-reducing hydrogenase subunit HndD